MTTAGAAAALLAAGAPALHAQSALGGEVFVAQTTSLPGSPGMGGFAATLSSGGFGIRGSAAFNRRYEPDGFVSIPWMADADLFVNSWALGQVIGIAMGAFSPVGFVGIGQQGIRDEYGTTSSVATFSYGAGASIPLFAGLRLGAELRQRRPISEITSFETYGMGTGREIRLSLSFGGGRPAAMPARSPRGGGGVGSGGVVRTGGGGAAASASARAVLTTAEQYLGSKYRYGGEDPRTGIDCSAYTQLVFRRNGVTLPRTSRQQVKVGREVLLDFGVIRPGDLLFFASDGTTIDHVAIYAGNGRIIHATASGGEVRYDDLGSQRGAWFVDHLVSARRVLDQGSAFVANLDAALKLAPLLDRGDRAPLPRR